MGGEDTIFLICGVPTIISFICFGYNLVKLLMPLGRKLKRVIQQLFYRLFKKEV